MIKCTVCFTENDPFETICPQCGSFLQNRIPNLNLFETLWGILESPAKTFPKITLAEHKNFSLFLFSLFGVSVSFTAFWYYQLGNRFSSLPELLLYAFAIGLVGGVVVPPIVALPYHFVARVFGRKATYRTAYSILAYSTTPIVLSLILVLPIELMTFGIYHFTANPHPFVIKPASYIALVSFDALVALWSIWLVVRGTKIAYRIGWTKSFIATIVAVASLLLFVTGIVGLLPWGGRMS